MTLWVFPFFPYIQGSIPFFDLDFSSFFLLQSKKEFDDVLDKHKAYVKSKFPNYTGSGQDAYADAGDLGADPEVLKAEKLKASQNGNSNGHSTANGTATTNGTNGHNNHFVKPTKVAVA